MKSKYIFLAMLGIVAAFLLSSCATESTKPTEPEVVKPAEQFSIQRGVHNSLSSDFLIRTEDDVYEYLASYLYDDHVENAKKDYVIADVVDSDSATYYVIRKLLNGKEVYGTEMLVTATPSSSGIQGMTYTFAGTPVASRYSKEECIASTGEKSFTTEKEVYYIRYSEEYYNVSSREAHELGIDIPELNSGWFLANDSVSLIVDGNTKEILNPEELYSHLVANTIFSVQ